MTQRTTADLHTSITQAVAEYAVSTTYEQIPEEVRERTRLIIVDEIASSAFGARTPAGGLMRRHVEAQGGRDECTVLGSRLRAPAALAALANGTTGHGEEVDGAHVVGGHPGATVVAAALAMAERQRATGSEFVNAVVLGYDIGTRLVAACGGVFGMRDRFHQHSDFLFSLGATVACSRLLGLDARRHRYALGLATFQSNGLISLFQEDRHMSKSFGNGQYASAGVVSALLASIGYEAAEDVLGATHGVLDAWGAEGAATQLIDGLGSTYAAMGANFKLTNAGYPIHAAMEAAVLQMREHAIPVPDVESVLIGMPANLLQVVDNRHMHNICVQDMVTAAIVRNGVGIRVLPFPETLDDPAYQRLRPLVRAEVDQDLDREQPNGRGARVTIRTSDGRSFSKRVEAPRGHSQRGGVTWADLEEKWRDGLPHLDIDRVLKLGQGLGQLDDVGELTAAFRVSSTA